MKSRLDEQMMVYTSIFTKMSTLALELKNAFSGSLSIGKSVLICKSRLDEQMMVYTSIFTKILWLHILRSRPRSFGIRNSVMSMKTCQDSPFWVSKSQVHYARNVYFISITCNDLLRVFLESGTYLWPTKMTWITIDAQHVVFLNLNFINWYWNFIFGCSYVFGTLFHIKTGYRKTKSLYTVK